MFYENYKKYRNVSLDKIDKIIKEVNKLDARRDRFKILKDLIEPVLISLNSGLRKDENRAFNQNQKDAILAATLGVKIIKLDNFTPHQITNTIKRLDELKLRKKVKIEASGRFNEKNISNYAKTGVDMISVGEITHSPQGIDVSLEIN